MRCSVCGDNDHNKRRCPNRIEPRDKAMMLQVEGMTTKEREMLSQKLISAKQAIAPKARATLVQADTTQLKNKVFLQLPSEDTD